MLKITNAFRWIYGIIFRKPTRFSWLIDRRLAGSDVPLTFNIDGCLSKGYKPQLLYEKSLSLQNGLIGISPLLQRIAGVAVHCSGGKGRTGTMLAAYLIKVQHLSAGGAIEQIRKVRPGSVESKRQELRLYEYRDYVYTVEKKKS